MQLCVICNSNPETVWPRRWQCWKENGKFSESLCKLLGLPKYYETDLQNSVYCSGCQKKVYNIYLMVRKWDRLQEDLTKLKQELEKNFHEALTNCKGGAKLKSGGEGKCRKTEEGIWILNSFRSVAREVHNWNSEISLTNNVSEAEVGRVNTLRRKILKRLSRSHEPDWDCNCCCDETIPETTTKGKCCEEWEHDHQKDHHHHQDDTKPSSGSESDYSSAEDCDHENCNLCRSSKEPKKEYCFSEKYCDDCPLCKEEEERKSKSKGEVDKSKDVLIENSEDTLKDTRSKKKKKEHGSPQKKEFEGKTDIKMEALGLEQVESVNLNMISMNSDNSLSMTMSTPGEKDSFSESGLIFNFPTDNKKSNSSKKPKKKSSKKDKDVSSPNLMLSTGGKQISSPGSASGSPKTGEILINYKEKRYRCYRSNCISSFSTAEDLDIHVKRHHEGIKRPYTCQECGKSFQRLRELNSHALKHSGLSAVFCHICGRGFRTKSLFELHLRTMHEEGDRKFKCSFCEKSFISESKLKTHLTIHTREYPFHCPVCGKGFSAKTFLNIHMSKHLDSNPYKCELCLKTFSSPRNLRIHQYTHDKTHPYKCPECDAGMPSETTLKQHMLKHEDEKSHACHVCDRKFQFPSSLKKHLKVHDGDKRFVCEYCSKTFIDKYKLTRHTRTHSGEKPYQCNVCQKCFATKDYLSTHMRKHSRATKRVPGSVPSVTISNASDESVTSFTLSINSLSQSSCDPFPSSSQISSSTLNTTSTAPTFSSPPTYVSPPSVPPAPASSVPSIMPLPEDEHPQVEDLTATIQLENLSPEQLLLMDAASVSSPFDPVSATDDVTNFAPLSPDPLLLPHFQPGENLDILSSEFCDLSFQNL